MLPTEIVTRYNLIEDENKANSAKRVWRGNRHKHGVIFADPTGDWDIYDTALKADVWDRLDPLRAGWMYIEGWIDGPYRVVWVNFGMRATFTYCEGDLTLVVCETEERFIEELIDAEKCYGTLVPRSYSYDDEGNKVYSTTPTVTISDIFGKKDER